MAERSSALWTRKAMPLPGTRLSGLRSTAVPTDVVLANDEQISNRFRTLAFGIGFNTAIYVVARKLCSAGLKEGHKAASRSQALSASSSSLIGSPSASARIATAAARCTFAEQLPLKPHLR